MRHTLVLVVTVLLVGSGIVYGLIVVGRELRRVSADLDTLSGEVGALAGDVNSIADDVNAIADALATDEEEDEPESCPAPARGAAARPSAAGRAFARAQSHVAALQRSPRVGPRHASTHVGTRRRALRPRTARWTRE
jgi:outer membrane murein-binding lipoprotein Lpp